MLDRARPPRATDSYLAAIYLLEEEGTVPTQIRLVQRLGHSAAAVSEMVSRLHASGLITANRRQLELTPAGTARAEASVRRHRLAERLLTDIIGVPWTTAHHEASRWEQIISDEVETLLVRLLGNPATSSLGTPIPGIRRPPDGALALAQAEPGDRVLVVRLSEALQADRQLIEYLADRGLAPGAQLEVQDKAPDGTLTLSSPRGLLTLAPPVARQIDGQFTAPAKADGSI